MSSQKLEKKTGHGLSEFLTWWSYELSLLVPAPMKQAFKQKTDRQLILFDDESYKLGTAENIQANASISDLKNLSAQLKTQKNKQTGLCLQKGQYLKRTLDLPSEARFKLDDILAIDMERKTPFKRNKVYTAHFYEDLPNKRLSVTQLVVKRALIDDTLKDLQAENISVSFITALDDKSEKLFPVNFLQATQKSERISFTAALYGIVGLLCVLLGFFSIDRQKQALDTLQTEIQSRQNTARIIQASAEKSHKEIAGILALQAYKTKSASTLDVWNEIARLLPDTAWITNLKIDNNKIQISGYAETAEVLIKQLDQSSLFTDVNFASPVTMDNQKKRERFSLSFKLKEASQ